MQTCGAKNKIFCNSVNAFCATRKVTYGLLWVTALGLFLLLGPFSAIVVAICLPLMAFIHHAATLPLRAEKGQNREESDVSSSTSRKYFGIRFLSVSLPFLLPKKEHAAQAGLWALCLVMALILGPFVAIPIVFMTPSLIKMAEKNGFSHPEIMRHPAFSDGID